MYASQAKATKPPHKKKQTPKLTFGRAYIVDAPYWDDSSIWYMAPVVLVHLVLKVIQGPTSGC